jgi:hypothetical protein
MYYFITDTLPRGKEQYGLTPGDILDSLPTDMPANIKNVYVKEGWILPFDDFLPNVKIPDIRGAKEPIDVEIRARPPKPPKAIINGMAMTTNGFSLSMLPVEFVVKIDPPKELNPTILIGGAMLPSTSGYKLSLAPFGEVTITIHIPVIHRKAANTVVNLSWTKIVGTLRFSTEDGKNSVLLYDRILLNEGKPA